MRAGLIIIFIWKVRRKRQNIGYLVEVKLQFLLNLGTTWKYVSVTYRLHFFRGKHFRYLSDRKGDRYPAHRECDEPYGQCGRDAPWRRGNTTLPGNWILVLLSSGRSLIFMPTKLPDAQFLCVRRRWPICIVDTASNGMVTEYWLAKVVGEVGW